MELYVLDALLRRDTVVDTFESLIWTERYRECGDFELDIVDSPSNRNLLTPGTRLAMNLSFRIMIVETISEKVFTMKVKGRSLEILMDSRVAIKILSGIDGRTPWQITGTPMVVAKTIFDETCGVSASIPADKIPFIFNGTVYAADTIASNDTQVTIELSGDSSVYESVKQIAETFDFGFRMTRDYDKSKVYFNVYTGVDRTTQQTLVPAVIFSQSLDNLQDVERLTSIENYKNVAYVVAQNGAVEVTAPTYDPSLNGFARRVIHVDASDIDLPAGIELTNKLNAIGQEELANYRQISGFDGEISQTSGYRYGIDYNLGDLVEMRIEDGTTNNMRVTEQIFVHDSEGERSYPTLTLDLFIMPGTWFAWDYNQVWNDALGQWVDAP